MFGVGYEIDGRKIFQVFDTMRKAQREVNKICLMGVCFEVTLYEYDVDSKGFVDVYTV